MQGEESSTESLPQKRVLSIQSHVVSGYVGNKAAVFPLQILGFDVDVVNSVHFSNHTGYGEGVEGDVLKGEQLRAILAGLERNHLLDNIGHLLTGYIGSESFLEAVLDVLKTLRIKDGGVRFVCDPVLGDDGVFYVPKELVRLYRDRVIPQADIVTPNQFEAEQLTGIKVDSVDRAQEACRELHKMGPRLVFITSMVFRGAEEEGEQQRLDDDDSRTMVILASQCKENNPDECEVWRVDCPVLPGSYTGTGDVTAALLLAHTALQSNDVPTAMEKVINTMFSLIERTQRHSGESTQSRELKLVQSKRDIEQPSQRFKAAKIR